MWSSSAGVPVAPSKELAPAAGDADDGVSLAHGGEHSSAASQDTGGEVAGEEDQASEAQVNLLRHSVRQSGLHQRWLMLCFPWLQSGRNSSVYILLACDHT